MKIVVIGGVAAGTKAAAKLKREQPDAEVVLYSKGTDISYAGCGLPTMSAAAFRRGKS